MMTTLPPPLSSAVQEQVAAPPVQFGVDVLGGQGAQGVEVEAGGPASGHEGAQRVGDRAGVAEQALGGPVVAFGDGHGVFPVFVVGETIGGRGMAWKARSAL